MQTREQAFHEWFSSAMPEFQAETLKLVNSVCIEATQAFMAGWDARARQEAKGSQATDA